MKIFVVHASAGAGHKKAAEALYNFIKENHKEIDIRLIDILDETTPLFNLAYNRGYPFLINHAVFLWHFFFWLTYIRPLRVITRSIAVLLSLANTKEFVELLTRENPDFVISTHFLPSEIAGSLKIKKKIKSKVITVITDFGAHPFWISAGTDFYVAATEFTKAELISEKVRADTIKVLGIPTDPKFLKQYERDSLCKKLGIEKDKFTILIITGSFGLGPIEEIVDLLHKDAQLLVVCANNRKLYKNLKKKSYPDCFVYGFADNVQELMSVSDMIITKPGGLTISEVFVIGILPIFICAIPGQETKNVSAIEYYGAGINVKDTKHIKDIVLEYKNNPGKFRKIKENMNTIKKPRAAEEIFNAICKSSPGPAG
jgi:processive 1,2-diacylglycerol beta-glucosyltransferase